MLHKMQTFYYILLQEKKNSSITGVHKQQMEVKGDTFRYRVYISASYNLMIN